MNVSNLQPGDRFFVSFSEEALTNLLSTNHPKLHFANEWLEVKKKMNEKEYHGKTCYTVQPSRSLGLFTADQFLWVANRDFQITFQQSQLPKKSIIDSVRLPEI